MYLVLDGHCVGCGVFEVYQEDRIKIRFLKVSNGGVTGCLGLFCGGVSRSLIL